MFLLCSLNSKGCSINFHCIFCQICHHIMLPHKYSSQLLLGHVHLTFLVILVMCSILQSHRKNLSIYIIAWNMYILLCFIAYFFNFIISSRDCSTYQLILWTSFVSLFFTFQHKLPSFVTLFLEGRCKYYILSEQHFYFLRWAKNIDQIKKFYVLIKRMVECIKKEGFVIFPKFHLTVIRELPKNTS